MTILYYKDTLEFSLIYKMNILFAIFSSLSVFSVRILSTDSALMEMPHRAVWLAMGESFVGV